MSVLVDLPLWREALGGAGKMEGSQADIRASFSHANIPREQNSEESQPFKAEPGPVGQYERVFAKVGE